MGKTCRSATTIGYVRQIAITCLRPSSPHKAPVAHPKVETHQSVGVQTDLVETVGNAISVLPPSGPALQEGSQTSSVCATKAPKVELSSALETTSTEVGSRAPWGHSERELPMEVDSTSNITIPSSVDISVTVPTPHAKHDDVKLDVCVFQSHWCIYS